MRYFGFRNPFPVCIPCPRRLGAKQMEPEVISFDGNIITVRYLANPDARRGFYDGQAIHQFNYLPDVTSIQSIFRHACNSRKLGANAIQNLGAIVSPAPVRYGTAVYIEELKFRRAGGLIRVGGKQPIYVLSPQGRKGTLLIGTSLYHKYSPKKIVVGRSKDYRWLPELTNEQLVVETFSGRVLKNC